MSIDPHLPTAPALDTGALPPLWVTLARQWVASTAAPAAEHELGYESALPFTLAEPLDAPGSPPAY